VITDTRVAPTAPPGPGRTPAGEPADDELMLRANKLDLLERLADGLAHEIKNPLHSMVINLEVLRRRVARADSADEVQRYVGVLAGELERVNRRIELLLRLSRPGRAAEPASLGELTEEVMELIQLEAHHHELTVDYHPEGGMARVQVRREPARRVILNLVFEAIDQLERGGTLRLWFSGGAGEARMWVSGSGSAAPMDGAAPPRLAAAAALAAHLGGRVTVEEGDGGGPALVFSLPTAGSA
jgi:signal transduction histidine kinase